MFVLIVGSGRVGSTVAKRMIESGHDVSVLDESPEAHARLDHGSEETWEELGGRFTVGTALEVDALLEAGIEQADVVICSTDGDNTNIVVAQIAQKRFHVPKVLARVLDPYRADWYREQGLETVCPTQSAIEMLTERATARPAGGSDPLMEETR
jgi:trk/ktr system potassium uptake protein